MQITDLIHYNHNVREAYLEAMAKLPWADVVAFRGLSWDSMRNVFLHLTLVEDRWVSYAVPGRINEWVDPDFDKFVDIELLRSYMQYTHTNTEKFLAEHTAEDLKRFVEVPWGEKPYAKLPIEAVLTHMVMEDMIHYGELSAAMWQMGQEPPYKAYWRYKHQHP